MYGLGLNAITLNGVRMREPRLIEPGSYGTRSCTESTDRHGGLTRAESIDTEFGM